MLSTDEVAILWVDPTDCYAPDLDGRVAMVEATVNRRVALRAAVENYRLIAAYRHPDVVTTRKLKEVFPTHGMEEEPSQSTLFMPWMK